MEDQIFDIISPDEKKATSDIIVCALVSPQQEVVLNGLGELYYKIIHEVNSEHPPYQESFKRIAIPDIALIAVLYDTCLRIIHDPALLQNQTRYNGEMGIDNRLTFVSLMMRLNEFLPLERRRMSDEALIELHKFCPSIPLPRHLLPLMAVRSH